MFASKTVLIGQKFTWCYGHFHGIYGSLAISASQESSSSSDDAAAPAQAAAAIVTKAPSLRRRPMAPRAAIQAAAAAPVEIVPLQPAAVAFSNVAVAPVAMVSLQPAPAAFSDLLIPRTRASYNHQAAILAADAMHFNPRLVDQLRISGVDLGFGEGNGIEPPDRDNGMEENGEIDDAIRQSLVLSSTIFIPSVSSLQAHEFPICVICQDAFEEGQAARMPKCLHKFHDGCLLEQYRHHANLECPVCRVTLQQLEDSEVSPPLPPLPHSTCNVFAGCPSHSSFRATSPNHCAANACC